MKSDWMKVNPQRLRGIYLQSEYDKLIDPIVRFKRNLNHIDSLRKLRKEIKRIDNEEI